MLSPLVTSPTGPRRRRAIGAASLLAAWLLAAPAAQAGVWQASGSLVDLSIEVEGAAAPLYPARDGSGRYYLEARAGCAYALRVTNRSPERVGVVLAVDGLNAISGERELGPSDPARRGRMYVIDPWDEVHVPRLAHVARGRAPVHLRGRARLLRGPQRTCERQDGMDPGLGLPRALRSTRVAAVAGTLGSPDVPARAVRGQAAARRRRARDFRQGGRRAAGRRRGARKALVGRRAAQVARGRGRLSRNRLGQPGLGPGDGRALRRAAPSASEWCWPWTASTRSAASGSWDRRIRRGAAGCT